MSKGFVITIDGPAASGKSTVARRLAYEMGLQLLDSGAMYRAVTLLTLERGIGISEIEKLASVAELIGNNLRIVMEKGDRVRILFGSRDITEEIRSADVGKFVSPVSAVPEVRAQMVRAQRNMALAGGVVAEGRDMGSTVFPDACVKIFLDALKQERVRRRYIELIEKSKDVTIEEVEKEIEMRDSIDSSRSASPLRIPDGAIIIDTTNMTVEEVISSIKQICANKGCG